MLLARTDVPHDQLSFGCQVNTPTTVLLCVFAAILVVSTARGFLRKQGIAKTIAEGAVTDGLLLAIQAPYSKTRARTTVPGRVWYFDSTAGKGVTIRYVFDSSSGMPPALYSAASNTMNLGVIWRRYRDLLAHRRQLEAQGLAKDAVDALMLQAAHDVTARAMSLRPGGANAVEGPDGYMQLAEPVPVLVHLRASANKKSQVVVTFAGARI
jgi:hypothetical protein